MWYVGYHTEQIPNLYRCAPSRWHTTDPGTWARPVPQEAVPIVRVLFFADSHLGFDLPTRERVRRRRRGHDFLANHEAALSRALLGDVDLVVHGGDVFDRPRVPPSLVHQAFAPFKRVADSGVPVFIVPGNHERSRIPHARLAAHPGIHVFDRPGAHAARVGNVRVTVRGFPYERKDVRSKFGALLAEAGGGDHALSPADTATGANDSEASDGEVDAAVRLLCVHHCVEGATVGPGEYVFRTGGDVISGRQIPEGFAAVLSGHIHRHQVLNSDLAGRRLAAPVVYPGSVERTSTAEIDESKGYLLLDFDPEPGGGRLAACKFVALPARPMIVREFQTQGRERLDSWLGAVITEAPPDAVLQLRISGPLSAFEAGLVRAAQLRRMSPPSMNLDLVVVGDAPPGRRNGRTAPAKRGGAEDERSQLAFPL